MMSSFVQSLQKEGMQRVDGEPVALRWLSNWDMGLQGRLQTSVAFEQFDSTNDVIQVKKKKKDLDDKQYSPALSWPHSSPPDFQLLFVVAPSLSPMPVPLAVTTCHCSSPSVALRKLPFSMNEN